MAATLLAIVGVVLVIVGFLGLLGVGIATTAPATTVLVVGAVCIVLAYFVRARGNGTGVL